MRSGSHSSSAFHTRVERRSVFEKVLVFSWWSMHPFIHSVHARVEKWEETKLNHKLFVYSSVKSRAFPLPGFRLFRLGKHTKGRGNIRTLLIIMQGVFMGDVMDLLTLDLTGRCVWNYFEWLGIGCTTKLSWNSALCMDKPFRQVKGLKVCSAKVQPKKSQRRNVCFQDCSTFW